MTKNLRVAGLALFLLVGAMSYMFVVKGAVAASEDGRTAIVLTADERALVLGEMREFLEAVKNITNGISSNDMKAVYAAGHKMGMAAAAGVPATLGAKLPMGFKKLGGATHKKFDTLAMEAQDIGDEKALLVGLGELLNNCTTCHASYRFEVTGAAK